MKAGGRPLRFIGLTLALWIGGRVAVVTLWDEREVAGEAEAAGEVVAIEKTGPGGSETVPQTTPALAGSPEASLTVPRRRPGPSYDRPGTGPRPAPGNQEGKKEEGGAAAAAIAPMANVSASSPQPALLRPAAASSRWTASAWLFLREGGGGGQLATGGQLGGAQAGARVTWRIDEARRLALFGRVSGPLRARGFEAASGIEWRPLAGLPVRLAVERRFAIERGGRGAFAVYAFGGVDAVPLGGLRLDAYGQAGVVGARARDPFADGSVRIGRELAVSQRTSVTLGGGAWGAAQPGVARLDVGPQAVVRLPVGDLGLALAIDWRLRVAGQARPGSGPTVTLGVDF